MKIKNRKICFIMLLIAVLLFFYGCDSQDEEEGQGDPIERPEVPTEVKATDGEFANQVRISWAASERAETYKIYKACDSVDSDYQIIQKEIEGIEFVDKYPNVNRRYFYKVVAVNSSGYSAMSAADEGYAEENMLYPPTAPENLTATFDKLYHVYLNWDMVENADVYHVYRSDYPDGIFEKITPEEGIADLNTINIKGLVFSFDDDGSADSVEGQAFYYTVSAENGDGESLTGKIVSGWFPYNVPDNPPATVSSTDGDYLNKIVISWDSVTEASFYKIFRATGNEDPCENPSLGAYEKIGSISGTSFDDIDVSQDVIYCYSIRACNEQGDSSFSQTTKGRADAMGIASPSAPINVTASNGQENQITVYWTRVDDLALFFHVFRCDTADGDYGAPISIVSNDVSSDYSYSDTDISTDVNYFYKIKAVNDKSESSLSNHAQGLALPTVPSAPVVTASDGTYWNQIEITWTPAERATFYNVLRSTTEDGSYDAIASSIDSFSFIDTSVEADFENTYYYKVQGINSGGDGALSDSNAGNVELGTTAGITVSDGGSLAIDVIWQAVEGATGYRVEYQLNLDDNWYLIPGLIIDTQIHHTNLKLWRQYKYRIAAVHGTHQGPFSAESGTEWSD